MPHLSVRVDDSDCVEDVEPLSKRHHPDPEDTAWQLAKDLAGETLIPSVISRRPLGDTLPGKIKAKIWAGRFIELSSLVPKYYEEDTYFNLAAAKGSGLTLKKKAGNVLSFDEWNVAFDTYISVMSVRPSIPDVVRQMIKHKAEVNHLQSSFPASDAWRKFDIEFRKAVAAPDVPVGWGTYDPALYGGSVFQALTSSLRKDDNRASSHVRRDDGQYRRQANNKSASITDRDTGITVPKRYCLSYHSGKPTCKSTPCRYLHECPTCKKTHPLIKCSSAKRSSDPNNRQ